MPDVDFLPGNPSFSQELGRALGVGVSQGLNQQMESYRKRKTFEKAGLPTAYADLDPTIVGTLLKQQQRNALIQQILNPQGQNANPVIQQGLEQDPISIGTQGPGLTSEQRMALSLIDPNIGRAAQKEEQFKRQEEAPIKERNLKLFDESTANLKASEDQDIAFGQLKNLSEKISKKEGQSFFERLGRTYRFDPETGSFSKIGKATSTPEEERFIKLIADQTKNIKNDYGARITNLDMEVFLRRFPDLMMTPQGRKDILDTLDDYNKAKQIYNRARKSTISSSKGKIDPYELDQIVESKIEKPLLKLRQKIAERGLSLEEGAHSASQYKEGDTASNSQGQTIIFKEGKWQPLP